MSDLLLDNEQARRLMERGIDALVLHHSAAHGKEIWELIEARQTPTIITRASEAVDGYTTVGYNGYTAFRQLTGPYGPGRLLAFELFPGRFP